LSGVYQAGLGCSERGGERREWLLHADTRKLGRAAQEGRGGGAGEQDEQASAMGLGVGYCMRGKVKERGRAVWASFGFRLKERERENEKTKMTFPFSNFCKLVHIQTKFEFKPLNIVPTIKQNIMHQHECNKNIFKALY
jgi:hypothetical protein